MSITHSCAHGRLLFRHFVRLVRRRTTRRRRITFCTRGLYVAPHCLGRVATSTIGKGAPGSFVSRRLATRVGIRLGGPSLSVTRVTTGYRFPSSSCLDQFFGGRAKVSPGRFQNGEPRTIRGAPGHFRWGASNFRKGHQGILGGLQQLLVGNRGKPCGPFRNVLCGKGGSYNQ